MQCLQAEPIECNDTQSVLDEMKRVSGTQFDPSNLLTLFFNLDFSAVGKNDD